MYYAGIAFSAIVIALLFLIRVWVPISRVTLTVGITLAATSAFLFAGTGLIWRWAESGGYALTAEHAEALNWSLWLIQIVVVSSVIPVVIDGYRWLSRAAIGECLRPQLQNVAMPVIDDKANR